MSTLIVPPLDEQPWPTLGSQVCAFIEAYLVFGPGDLRGEPARLDAEKRALLYRMYEIYPQGHRAAGRRRFKRCGISLRKGTAKTELAAWIAAVELHSDGPVRCDGFDAYGEPVGRGVTDPYIPMVACTEEQSDELAYGALRVILGHSPLADDFDIGLERIMRIDGDGKAVSLATSPSARDGARTTMQVFDETHRLTSPRLRAAHRTMLANVPKRYRGDAWSLEITTAPAPGENSIAEDTMDYARQVADGELCWRIDTNGPVSCSPASCISISRWRVIHTVGGRWSSGWCLAGTSGSPQRPGFSGWRGASPSAAIAGCARR